MNFPKVKHFCDAAWSRKHGFVVLNICEDPFCRKNCGRWANYDTIYVPEKYLNINDI
jgi:hypothetical protein